MGFFIVQNQHLKGVLESTDPRAVRSEGPSWAGICWVTSFQWGLRSVDIRESLCRIKEASGSSILQAYFLYLSDTSFYPETGI